MTFTDKLKELVGKSVPAPWVESSHDVWNVREDGHPGIPLLREEIGNYRSWGRETSYEEREANAALIVLLVNHAEDIVALVEAAKPFADIGCPRTFDGDSSDVLALRAALSRLDGGAK